MATTWQRGGWTEPGDSAWERIKEAIRRDWEQTLHDLQIEGGHELNQRLADTIKQAAGRQAIPRHNQPNPPRFIGNWGEVNGPIGYGAPKEQSPEQAARFEQIEQTLRSEWDSEKSRPIGRWDVRRGYGYERRD